MRLRLSTLALSAAVVTSTIAATYWRDRARWWSQDEVDAWNTRAKIELADMDDEASPNGEAKMLVARHEDPDDPSAPYYVHVVVAGPSDAGAFRPMLERNGWARTRAIGWDVANLAADDLLLDLLVTEYDPYDGMDLDDIEWDALDGDDDDTPVA